MNLSLAGLHSSLKLQRGLMCFLKDESDWGANWFQFASNVIFRPGLERPSDMSGGQKMIKLGKLSALSLSTA